MRGMARASMVIGIIILCNGDPVHDAVKLLFIITTAYSAWVGWED